MDDQYGPCRPDREPFRADEITEPDSFDSSVHISEEASNAAVAVPRAIVSAIAIAGVLGLGTLSRISYLSTRAYISISCQYDFGILHG